MSDSICCPTVCPLEVKGRWYMSPIQGQRKVGSIKVNIEKKEAWASGQAITGQTQTMNHSHAFITNSAFVLIIKMHILFLKRAYKQRESMHTLKHTIICSQSCCVTT